MIQLLNPLLNFAFPRHCLLCKTPSLGSELLCLACTQDLPYHQGKQCRQCAVLIDQSATDFCGHCLAKPPAFDQTHALFSYQDPIPHFVMSLKFGQRLVYGELLGKLFAAKIQNDPLIKLPECLIPIPLHLQRLRERGYNQALCITKTLGKSLELPIASKLVERDKQTQPQSNLRLKERLVNVRNAFSLHKKADFSHVAIVDDVMTTGQTVNEVAKCLKKGGVARVDAWCVARAL